MVLGLVAVGAFAAGTEAEADKHFQAQDWRRAAEAYQQLVTVDATRGSHWFRLGMARQALHQPEASLEAYSKARALHFKPVRLYIRAAILLTQSKQYDKAIHWLRELLDTGFAPSALESVAPLAALRQTDSYRQLTSSYGPPCSQPQFRALDFWVGDFDVQTPQGQVAGHNQIVKILNGCVLQENWTSAGGGDGKSFTWFDADMKKWRQLYLGANGHSHEYIGEARDGALHFLHDRRHPDGSRQMFRMSFTPRDNGKVRQFIEESWDAGKSWSVWFDGMYVPAKKE